MLTYLHKRRVTVVFLLHVTESNVMQNCTTVLLLTSLFWSGINPIFCFLNPDILIRKEKKCLPKWSSE